jgi:hypothetical protein
LNSADGLWCKKLALYAPAGCTKLIMNSSRILQRNQKSEIPAKSKAREIWKPDMWSSSSYWTRSNIHVCRPTQPSYCSRSKYDVNTMWVWILPSGSLTPCMKLLRQLSKSATLQLTSWFANVWVCNVLYYCYGVAFMI